MKKNGSKLNQLTFSRTQNCIFVYTYCGQIYGRLMGSCYGSPSSSNIITVAVEALPLIPGTVLPVKITENSSVTSTTRSSIMGMLRQTRLSPASRVTDEKPPV